MGSAYGFGGIGKIIGPLGLALIIGSSSVIKPDVSLKAIIPAFLYFASFYVLAGLAFVLIGFETKGMSILQIDSRRDEYPVGHQP
jgi:putative MFS transporter